MWRPRKPNTLEHDIEILRPTRSHTLPSPRRLAGETESSPKLSPHPIYACCNTTRRGPIAGREKLGGGSYAASDRPPCHDLDTDFKIWVQPPGTQPLLSTSLRHDGDADNNPGIATGLNIITRLNFVSILGLGLGKLRVDSGVDPDTNMPVIKLEQTKGSKENHALSQEARMRVDHGQRREAG